MLVGKSFGADNVNIRKTKLQPSRHLAASGYPGEGLPSLVPQSRSQRKTEGSLKIVKHFVIIDSSRGKSLYPPLPPHYTPPPSRRRVSFLSPKNSSSESTTTTCCPAMHKIIDNESGTIDVISFEHSACRDQDNSDPGNNESEINYDTDGEIDEECDEDARMRGGCGGGGGGAGCCCSSGGGRTNFGHDDSCRSPCGKRYQKERSSTIEGACGCGGGRGKSGCGVNSGGCCSSGAELNCHHSPRTGGCCGTSCDESNEGACATKAGRGCRLTGCETCPPRSPDPCSTDPTSLSSCSAAACSPPCSGRKGCCPPAGCRPVRRIIPRCNTPCTGDAQSCGGGGCCGSGCRGGCGKPGQTCLPLRPCTIPPCQPHPQGGGSPCMPPRNCAPQPPCCRTPVILGTPSSMSGAGRSGGSSCCRTASPGRRSGGGGGCCQQQDDVPFGSCCQAKLPAGCECLGGGQDCQRCGRKVYQAEMQIASGVPYHNICFSCFCCRKPLETLTYHENCGEIYCKPTCIFNEGFTTILKILDTMGVKIGQQAEAYARLRDQQRIDRSERRSLFASKEARTARREAVLELDQFYERKEGAIHGLGLAD